MRERAAQIIRPSHELPVSNGSIRFTLQVIGCRRWLNWRVGMMSLVERANPLRKYDWKQVVELAPDVIVLMPCGFDIQRTANEATILEQLDGWHDLPAVKAGRVFAVNGHAFFSRPGPRLVDGLELLAHIIHPEIFPMQHSPDARSKNCLTLSIVTTTAEAAGSSHSHVKDILRLAVPAMLALASQPLLSIGDTAMIGRLGVEPLAARAVGAAIIGGIYWIFAFLSFGTTTLVGYHHGAQDFRACGETYLHALFLALLGGVAVACAGLLFANPALQPNGCRSACNQRGSPLLSHLYH